MSTRCIQACSLVALIGAAATAQKPPAVRPLGPIVRVSTEPLSSVFMAVPLSDGRVYVNDVVARRVLLFDSTLAKAIAVADSTSATSNAYGARPGTLIPYRADSALFVDPASQSMPVLSPAGKIARVMAIPRPSGGAPFMVNTPFASPAVDARGRLVATIPPAPPMRGVPPGPGKTTDMIPDSTFLVRFDLASRTFDTVGVVRTPWGRMTITRDEDGRLASMEAVQDLLPLIDDWTVLSDGTIAIVRGRDYHVDWLGADGRWASTPKMLFDWQHLDDAQKTSFIDSSLAATKARRDSMMASRGAAGAPPPPSGDGARGGRGGGGGGGPVGPPPAMIDGRPALGEIPDYRPPFARGSVRADADGNIWIRTTTLIKGQPVYDIVNRRGELIDRVQLPPFRTIAGFGPGVVYMAVKDPAGAVHLERARVK